jgi:hypothetical protein
MAPLISNLIHTPSSAIQTLSKTSTTYTDRMPSAKRPTPTHFEPVAPTKENLDYANLPTIDFALFKKGEEGRKELAKTLNYAMREHGFFYVINHGISEEEIERQVDIGYTVIEETPLEEKKALESKIEQKGVYRGFKLRNYYKHPHILVGG